MIHLHSVLSDANTSTSGQNSGAALSQSKLDSFHGALSDAVSSTMEKFGIQSSDVKISITSAGTVSRQLATTTSDTSARTTPPPGTSSGTSGASASTGSSSSSSASSSTSSGPPDNGYDPFLQAAYSNPFASATTQPSTASSTTASSAQSSTAPLDAQQAFDEAYWAAQPPAVQALQNIQDPSQRAALATQLANEGYSIDVPIMVWGWDPSITMSMREADGYTWVPSALQNPVDVAPGLGSMGTLAAYDPNSPPAGSIAVS